MAKLPKSVVRDLNAVGFVLTMEEPAFAFVRLALGSELYLQVEPLPNGRWRIRLSWRDPTKWGRIANPLVPVSLAKLGEKSVDGSLELQTAELVSSFPRLLETCILPTNDLAPS